MRISTKGALEVVSTDHAKPIEFYANVDLAKLTKDTLEIMAQVKILKNDSKPAQAKIAEKFKEAIFKDIKDQEMYNEKSLFDAEVKEEPVWG